MDADIFKDAAMQRDDPKRGTAATGTDRLDPIFG